MIRLKLEGKRSIGSFSMAIYYHEVREGIHLLKDRGGVEVFRGEEHQLVTRTYQRTPDRYMTYRDQQAMGVAEFLLYLRSLREGAKLGPPVRIPNQRRSGEGRVKGRSVD
jgi:hypothetical protein